MNDIYKEQKSLVSEWKERSDKDGNQYIKELPCYQRKGCISEKNIRVMEQHFYNLDLLTMEGQKRKWKH